MIEFDRIIDGADKRRRTDDWCGILIHHTAIGNTVPTSESVWRKLHRSISDYLGKKDDKYVSAHFQIGRFGEITQIIDPDRWVAYHAGTSSFWHPINRKWTSGCNEFFIGIEVVGDGNLTSYSEEQYKSIAKLCRCLMQKYPTIQPHCITGHEVVAPGRKVDPGKYFDWRKLFRLIFNEALVG